jgi:hypothetical protein
MPDYRAYIIGIDGHRYIKAPQFFSDHPDDATALKAAEQLADGHDVEVWDGGRLVARFDYSHANFISGDPTKAELRKLLEEA